MFNKINTFISETGKVLNQGMLLINEGMLSLSQSLEEISKQQEIKLLATQLFKDVLRLFISYRKKKEINEAYKSMLSKFNRLKYVNSNSYSLSTVDIDSLTNSIEAEMILIEKQIKDALHPFYGDLIYRINIEQLEILHEQHSLFISELYLEYKIKEIENRISFVSNEILDRESKLKSYNLSFIWKYRFIFLFSVIPSLLIYLEDTFLLFFDLSSSWFIFFNIISISISLVLLFIFYHTYRKKLQSDMNNLQSQLSQDNDTIYRSWNEIKQRSRERFI